ncbi:MAG: hypothetical protein HQM09_12155 [Candidatus Riflebacteria bacterium]|nr:hypothetical protein [Candidatus Riflebacteria bacterium]
MIHCHMVGVEECFLIPGFAEWLEQQLPETLCREAGEIWHMFRTTAGNVAFDRRMPRLGGRRHG